MPDVSELPPINTPVLVDAPGDQPYLATFLGCIVDERDQDMAVVRPKGWVRKLIVVHPSCIEPTDRW